MGHDIYAFSLTKDEQDALRAKFDLDKYDTGWLDRFTQYEKQAYVAYLRLGAFDPDNGLIYEALNSTDLNGGCSGTGASRRFHRDDINNAIACFNDPEEREYKFLKSCLDHLAFERKHTIEVYFG